ncbi:MAG: exosome complex exonuclease Rrp41 [Nanoarchaeota archaeon]
MAYTKRFDGRAIDETRPITAKVGIIPRANGSAMFQIGATTAIAAVYGPREMHPKFMQNPKGGVLRCHYSMMPFSGHGDRVKPGQNRRAKEISRVIENSLRPVVDLTQFPNAVVDVFIELPQTDAGTRCAGITAAAMALADAGIDMKDLVAAVAIGFVDDRVVADLNYNEEHYNDYSDNPDKDRPVADIPIAMLPTTGEVSLLQMDGKVRREALKDALQLGITVCRKINDVQRKALKAKYAE